MSCENCIYELRAADEEPCYHCNKFDAFRAKTSTVDHPAHYQGTFECIDEMISLFGVEAVKSFCRCNVYKYRFRANQKNGEEDIKKAEWYMTKLKELEETEE